MRQISKSFWLTLLLTVFMTASAAAAVVKTGTLTGVTKVSLEDGAEVTAAGVTASGDIIIAVTPTDGNFVAELKIVQLVNASEAQARRAPGFADLVQYKEIVPTNAQLTAAGLTGQDDYFVKGVRFYQFAMPTNGRSVEVSAKAQPRIDFPIADLEIQPTVFTYNTKRQVPEVKKVASPATLTAADRNGTAWVETFPTESTNANAIDGTLFDGVEAYKVKIVGIGKYKGTFETLTYKINAKTITPEMVTLSEHSFIYNGKNQKPATVTVYFDPQNQTGTDKVVAASDYTLTNDGGTNAGNYTVTVTGKATATNQANFTGTATRNFTIKKFDISNLTWEINPHDLLRDADDAEYNATAKVITYDERTHKYSVKTPTIPSGVDLLATALPVETTDFKVTWNYTNDADFKTTGTKEIYVKSEATSTNFTGNVNLAYAIIEKGIEPFDVNIKLYTDNTKATEVGADTYVYDMHEKKPYVYVTNHNGVEMATDQYTVEYKNNVNAGVNTATVIVSGKGSYSGKITKTFTINPYDITGTKITYVDPAAVIYNGADQVNIIPTTFAANFNTGTETQYAEMLLPTRDYMYVWTNDHKNANSLDGTLLDGKELAKATITGQGNYKGTRTMSLIINQKALSAEMLQFDKDDFIYNRAQQNPVVTVADNESALVMPAIAANTAGDFTSADIKVTIPASVDAQNAGPKTYTVTVTAVGLTGNYKGTISRDYRIDAYDLSQLEWIINATDAEYNATTKSIPYDQIEHKYDVTAPEYVSVALVGADDASKDYKRTWPTAEYTETGVKNIHIVGTNNFKGTVDLSYSIVEKGIESFTAIKLFTDNTKATEVDADTYVYDMHEKKPFVEVKNHENQLMTLGTDYTVEYKDNVNRGTATVIISGKGHYSGVPTASTTFVIKPYDITGTAIAYADPDAVVYNGVAQTALPKTFKATFDDKSENLVNDKDYTIGAWSDNKNTTAKDEKKGTATITGQGNYTGTRTISLDITKKPLSAEMIQFTDNKDYFVYNRAQQNPEVKVVDNEVAGTALISPTWAANSATAPTAGADDDVTITVPASIDAENSGAKTYTVTVNATAVAKSNYTGEITRTYKIDAKDINDLAWTIKPTAADEAAGLYNASNKTIKYDKGEHKYDVNVPTYEGTALTLDTPDEYDIAWPTADYLNPGIKEIALEGKGNFKGQLTLGYSIIEEHVEEFAADAVTITLPTGGYVYDNTDKEPVVTVVGNSGETLTQGTDYEVEYKNNHNAGTATVYVSGKGHYSGVIEKTFTIAPYPIDGTAVTLTAIPAVTYNGKAQTPEVAMTAFGLTLNKGVDGDFTVAYASNTHAYETPEVTITGVKNFTGTRTTTFTINRKTLTVDMLTLTPDFFTYDGTDHYDDVEITIRDDEGTDYLTQAKDIESIVLTNSATTEVTEAVEKDTYTVTVTAKATGDYTGTIAKNFVIGEENINNDKVRILLADGSAFPAEYVYTGQAIQPEILIQENIDGTWQTMSTDNYQNVTWANNTDVTYEGNTVVAGASVTIWGKGDYDERSKKVVTFMITRRDISDPALVTMQALEAAGYTFTGDPIEPAIVLTNTATNAQLTEDGDKADYMVEYTNNVKATSSPATVTITGQGNYCGTIIENFDINAKDLAGNVRIQNIEDQVYTGFAIEPAIVVTDILSGRKLAENTDYVLTYADNVNVGTATVTLTGAGNYTGQEEKTFKIVPKDINLLTITIDPDRIKYTGQVVTTEIASIVDEAIDATVELKDGFAITGYDCATGCVEKGTHYAIIEQVNNPNYTGQYKAYFTIYDKDFNDPAFAFDVEIEPTMFVYDGTRKEPKVTLTDKTEGNDVLLIEGQDYTISYLDNYGATVKKAGELPAADAHNGIADRDAYVYYEDETINLDDPTDTYRNIPTIVITGKGGFVGQMKVEFRIYPRTIMFAKVQGDAPHVEYNGKLQNPDGSNFTVLDINGNTLVEGYDYTIDAPTHKDAGEYKMSIRGRHNYDVETTLESTFFIDKKPLVEEMVAFNKSYFTYNGELQHPIVTVQDGAPSILTMATDVEIVYPEENSDEAKRKDPIDVGTYTIEVKATEEGNYSGWVAKDYKIGLKSVNNVQIADIAEQTFTGAAIEPELTVTLINDNGTELTLVNEQDYKATYSNNINAGEATVQIVGQGNYSEETFAEKTFVIAPKSIETATVAGITDKIYSGAAIEQTFTVTDADRDYLLVENDDYTVAYEDNEVAGTAKVTITGKGNYTGVIEQNFTIERKGLDVTIAPIADVVYNRAEQKIAPVLTDNDTKKVLEADVDYTVAYTGDLTNVGEVTVTITGITNFQGTLETTYNIVAKDIANFDVTLTPDAYEYDAIAKEPVATVKDGEYTLTADEYDVAYVDNINAGTAKAVITGKGNYTGTVTKAFNIGGKSIESFDFTLAAFDAVYNGQAKTPAVTMKNQSNQTMTENTDFTVDYKDNVNAGTATVTVIGKGFYHGSVSKTFTIEPRSIDLAAVAAIPAQQFTGAAIEPAVTVSDLNTVLVEGTDYTVAIAQNVNVADAPVVTLTGMGNYTAAKVMNNAFAITPKPITASMVALSQENFVYNRANQKPAVAVTDDENGIDLVAAGYATITNDGGVEVGQYDVKVVASDNYIGTIIKKFSIVSENAKVFDVALAYTTTEYTGSALTPAVTVKDGAATLAETNYTVVYDNNVNVGKAVVTVTGKNGYEGTVTKTFDITARSVSTFTVNVAAQTYTGSVLKPAVEVKDGAKVLVINTDYSLEYNNNLNAGTATVTVSGKGNYKDVKVVNFVINPKNVAELTIAAIAQQTYTGEAITPAVNVSYNGKQLVAGQDFDVTYTDNVNVGTSIVSIQGKGNYTGTNGLPFMIAPKALNAGMLERYETVFTYNGAVQKPVVKVIDRERNVELGADQVLIDNAGGIEIGNYTFTVQAKAGANYTGTLTGNYSITDRNAANFDVVLEYAHHVFTNAALEPVVTVTDAGNAQLADNSGFTIEYANNVNVGKASVKVTGTGNYRGEVTKFFDITPKSITELAIAGIENVTYTGEAFTPAVTVTYGDTELVLDTDYTVTYADNTNAGTAAVTIKGWGNYTDEIVKNFVIAPKNISDDMVVVTPETVVFNGELQVPEVVVTDAERNVVLVAGQDYQIVNNGGVNVGTYAVTVTGINNYTAAPMVAKVFTITPKQITAVEVADIVAPVTNDLLDTDAACETEGVDAISAITWTPAAADGKAAGETAYTASVVLTANSNYEFAADVTATVDDDAAVVVLEADGKLTVNYTFAPTLRVIIIDDTYVVSIPDPAQKDVVIDKANAYNGETVLYVPATVEIDGETYKVTEIADNAFASWTALADVYMPETEEPILIGDGAFDNGTVVNIHTPLSLLDDYALAPALEDNFEAGKISAPLTFVSRLITFSCGVDVQVPDGVKAHYVKAKNDNAVTLVELADADLYVGGVAAVKANNGVIFSGVAGQTYTIVAHAGRQISGTPVATGDAEDYADNLLEPVIEAKSYDADKYYVLYQDEFRVIADESKVPANKAVLRKPSANSSSRLTIDLGEPDGIERIEALFGADENKWYDLRGNRINRPTQKGVYILNGHKVAVK